MNKFLKIFIGGLVILAFIITLPGGFQNGTDYSKFRDELPDGYGMIDDICSSDCKNHPKDWIIPGYELEAENYCLTQCMDKGKMRKGMRDALLANFQYRSTYHRRVGQIYCLLGLNCFDNK